MLLLLECSGSTAPTVDMKRLAVLSQPPLGHWATSVPNSLLAFSSLTFINPEGQQTSFSSGLLYRKPAWLCSAAITIHSAEVLDTWVVVTFYSIPSPTVAIRPEGKNNRMFVFSISMASVSRWSLDVAADTHEELLDWVKKIREAAQTADARVSSGDPHH